jgi:hypothetical protein
MAALWFTWLLETKAGIDWLVVLQWWVLVVGAGGFGKER